MNRSLQARLLTGVIIIVVVQIVTAVLVISTTSDQILDEVDARLLSAAVTIDDAPTNGLTESATSIRGSSDHRDDSVNAVFERNKALPAPVVTIEAITGANGRPFTADAEQSEDKYRVLAIDIGDDSWFTLAGLLDGYEWTINRLIQAVAVTATIVGLVLAAVTWWVLRLGIKPVKDMTATAEAIAAGDLSGRIEDPGTGTVNDQDRLRRRLPPRPRRPRHPGVGPRRPGRDHRRHHRRSGSAPR